MALPIAHPLHEQMVTGAATSVATGVAGVIRAPFKGTIREVGTMIGSVVSTADATVTTSIAGTAITGGAFVITQSSSAIGDLDAASVSGTVANGVAANATITAANTCLEGDVIKFAMTGSLITDYTTLQTAVIEYLGARSGHDADCPRSDLHPAIRSQDEPGIVRAADGDALHRADRSDRRRAGVYRAAERFPVDAADQAVQLHRQAAARVQDRPCRWMSIERRSPTSPAAVLLLDLRNEIEFAPTPTRSTRSR
jgi:hypothetical protein